MVPTTLDAWLAVRASGCKRDGCLAAGTAHQIGALARRELTCASQRGQIVSAAADYSDARALRTALRGVDTLVFVSSDGPVAQVVVHHHNVVRAAADSGVSHIAVLSGLDAALDSPFCLFASECR